MGVHRIADGPYSVIVIDMFHYDEESNVVVRGFPTLELAAEYARRRTRDSLEELRSAGQSHAELRNQWYTFGEDCIVSGEGAEYRGAADIDFFIDHPATAEERDWMAIEKIVTSPAKPPRDR
jgi:hypothetical protein